MVLLTDIEDWGKKAQALITKSPNKTRLSVKYRKQGNAVLAMKITDGKECYRIKITTDTGFKRAQDLISTITNYMASNEIMKQQNYKSYVK